MCARLNESVGRFDVVYHSLKIETFGYSFDECQSYEKNEMKYNSVGAFRLRSPARHGTTNTENWVIFIKPNALSHRCTFNLRQSYTINTIATTVTTFAALMLNESVMRNVIQHAHIYIIMAVPMPRIRLSIVCYCAYSLLQLFGPHAHQSTTEINAPQYYTIIRPEFVGCLLSTDCCLTVHKLSSFLLPVFFCFFQYTALSALSLSLSLKGTRIHFLFIVPGFLELTLYGSDSPFASPSWIFLFMFCAVYYVCNKPNCVDFFSTVVSSVVSSVFSHCPWVYSCGSLCLIVIISRPFSFFYPTLSVSNYICTA